MRFTFLFFSLLFLIIINSCAFINSKMVEVSIDSTPDGASIFIDGVNYGKTPKLIDLEPSRNYEAFIKKDGYQVGNIKMEVFHSVRGNRPEERSKCIIDTLLVFPIIFRLSDSYAIRCKDFKKSQYSVNLIPEIKANQSKINNRDYRFIRNEESFNEGNFNQPNQLPYQDYRQQDYRKPNFNTAQPDSQNQFLPPIPGGPQAAPGQSSQIINIPEKNEVNSRPSSFNNQQQYDNDFYQTQQNYVDSNSQNDYQEYINRQIDYKNDFQFNGQNSKKNFNLPDKTYNSWQ